eukprot:9932367-Prorocentrum_lima.AAC.1
MWIVYEGELHTSTIQGRADCIAVMSISFRMGDGIAEQVESEEITWDWTAWETSQRLLSTM